MSGPEGGCESMHRGPQREGRAARSKEQHLEEKIAEVMKKIKPMTTHGKIMAP